MGDTVKTHIDLQRMQQEVWKLNNTFKANTHITIHIAFIIFNLEVLFDQVTDFRRYCCFRGCGFVVELLRE